MSAMPMIAVQSWDESLHMDNGKDTSVDIFEKTVLSAAPPIEVTKDIWIVLSSTGRSYPSLPRWTGFIVDVFQVLLCFHTATHGRWPCLTDPRTWDSLRYPSEPRIDMVMIVRATSLFEYCRLCKDANLHVKRSLELLNQLSQWYAHLYQNWACNWLMLSWGGRVRCYGVADRCHGSPQMVSCSENEVAGHTDGSKSVWSWNRSEMSEGQLSNWPVNPPAEARIMCCLCCEACRFKTPTAFAADASNVKPIPERDKAKHRMANHVNNGIGCLYIDFTHFDVPSTAHIAMRQWLELLLSCVDQSSQHYHGFVVFLCRHHSV